MTATISIDIVSDIVCPWCAIGYRQLERAVATIKEQVEVGIRWHPYELAPGMPPEGMNIADYMRERYGATPEQGSESRKRIVEIGKSLGIDFRYSPESRMYNTRRGHRLLAWAGQKGGQTALKLALFDSFFTQQKNVHEVDVLLDAVKAAKLDADEARAVLDDPQSDARLESELAHWRDQNITGVPAFIVNGKYMIPGAQDAETWVRVLERVIEREGLAA